MKTLKTRFLTFITAGVATLGIISCQDDSETHFSNESNTPTLQLELKDAQSSRTLISGNSVSWKDGDKLGIYYGDDATPLPFTVSNSESGAVAQCDTEGIEWEKGKTFYGVFPYNASAADIHKVAVTMPESFEQSDAEATALGDYDLLVAEPATWSNDEITVKFHHIVSFIDFVITNDASQDMTLKGVSITAENSIIPIAGEVNITLSSASEEFAKVATTETTTTLKVSASGEWTTIPSGATACLRLAMLPTDMSNEAIKVTYETSLGNFTIETYGKDFKRGTAYTFNKSIGWDGNSAEISGLTEFKFAAVNNEGLFQDIVFKKQNDNSFVATTVPEVDLSAIIPTFDYAGKVTMEGKEIESNKTAVNFPDETTLRFDGKIVKFVVNREYTIPVVRISTDNNTPVTTKEYYIGCQVKIDGKNMYEDYTTITESDSIRGRGNSTWLWYDKKPYRIKLGKKESLLGLGKGKSYVLLANYRDPSNMMNAVAFDMARYMEMPYTNSYCFVEVYMNDEYIGLYMLTEQIQQGGKRVDVEDQGGLLLSLDCDDGPNLSPDATDNFLSEEIYVNYSNSTIPVCVKHPEDQTWEQLQEIRSQFGDLERIIIDYDYDSFKQCMNVESYMAFFIIQEMTRNVELPAPRSMYIHRHANGMWAMGPVWDFDGGFAYDWGENHGYFGNQSWVCGENPGERMDGGTDFFDRMFANEEYKTDFKAYWNNVSQGMYNYAMERMDDNYKHSKAAMQRDAERWPISKSYSTSISQLRQWLGERIRLYQSVVDNM
ncbi:MAG: CotH kinase family protein [Marinifilaceae bacterium]|nr:CotH kinase family protein [Marinifilaceae bacterium]